MFSNSTLTMPDPSLCRCVLYPPPPPHPSAGVYCTVATKCFVLPIANSQQSYYHIVHLVGFVGLVGCSLFFSAIT